MIYDKLQVYLLTELMTQSSDSAYAEIARYLLGHASTSEALSIKEIARACHVGTGTVSRFSKDVGFASFADLRKACENSHISFDAVAGSTASERSESLARHVALSVAQAAASLDKAALKHLVDDLRSFDKVSAYGPLKAQAAAVDLQVDLLRQGKLIYTCATPAEQAQRIASAKADELILIFSYTGTYFENSELADSLRRPDRPRIWMICGDHEKVPAFVHGCLSFSSDHSQLSHPYQLECVAGIIAQEYAAAVAH
ncbi:MAG: MurR/RpiR family transcriptional regulator [Atopobiaceae bacterium]|nr:MurR/RpiR family transcriptional regulator [Atopobiaceae bacterium]